MIFEQIKEFIVDELNIPAEDITKESRISEDLGADSIDAVELIMQAEEEFEIEIDDETAMGIKTIQDLIDVIEDLKE